MLTHFSGISFLYAIWHSTLVRSQLTVDDVDFTVYIATSVLSDLVEKCPPAEACRDAFARMSKATISMVMNTTGFGNASTLGSQPLNSPGGYFRKQSGMQAGAGSQMDAAPQPTKRKMPMPQFDMNLRDLFSDEEIASRPLTHQPMIPGVAKVSAAPILKNPPNQQFMPVDLKAEPSSYTMMSPQSSASMSQYAPLPPQQATSLSHQVSNQQPYQPFAETISQAQPEFAFDDLSFLDSFPVTDPNNVWGNANDLDLGFGTGGTGFDGNGAWEANGGVDLFDGFFFGNS